MGLWWFKFQFMVLVCGGGLCNNGGELVVMVSAIGSMGCSAFFFFWARFGFKIASCGVNCGIYGLWCGGCESHLLSFSCQGGGRGLR